MTDTQWNALSDAEKKAWVKHELDEAMHVLTMLQSGLAVRRAGLIYFLPLCHDAYGQNY